MIDNLQLDCIVHEDHEYTNNVTEFPVEQGFNISDHVIHYPEKVTLEGIVTNTPIAFGAPNKNRKIEALKSLLATAGYDAPDATVTGNNLAKAVDIVTGLRPYLTMLLVHLTIPQDSHSANALHFTAEFRRLIVV